MPAYIVTFKLPKRADHNPTAKLTGTCPVSKYCSDVTGQHHSALVLADSMGEVKEKYKTQHITRIEEV